MHPPSSLASVLLLIGVVFLKSVNSEIISSCRETSTSGEVTIQLNDSVSFQALCVQRHRQFGDGWLVIQQRIGLVGFFYRNWIAYREGFGDFNTSFWLGLDKIYELTSRKQHELVVEFQPASGPRKYSRYDSFGIGDETERYVLKELGSYNGTARDCITASKGAEFSTFDDDNNIHGDSNCAVESQGAWWYTKDWYVLKNIIESA